MLKFNIEFQQDLLGVNLYFKDKWYLTLLLLNLNVKTTFLHILLHGITD